MYSPVHAAAGLLLAKSVNNPWAAVGLGVLSHYLLDAVPRRHRLGIVDDWP